VDWSSITSLHNLIDQYEILCLDNFYIGMFGTCFLLGIVFGCLTLSRLGDIYGRKPIIIIGMLIQITCVGIIVLSKHLFICYFAMFFLGIAVTGKTYVGFPYLIEFVP
jgi:DHA1 family bicyclomycin/chloramphenicol resistance-like MFS transporter